MIQLLVVDDSEMDRDIYQYALKRQLKVPYHITEVDDGKQGLAHMGEALDVVLIDYYLPDMTGLEFISQWRESDKKTPLVMISGQCDDNIMAAVMVAGATAYLVKESCSTGYLDKLVEMITP